MSKNMYDNQRLVIDDLGFVKLLVREEAFAMVDTIVSSFDQALPFARQHPVLQHFSGTGKSSTIYVAVAMLRKQGFWVVCVQNSVNLVDKSVKTLLMDFLVAYHDSEGDWSIGASSCKRLPVVRDLVKLCARTSFRFLSVHVGFEDHLEACRPRSLTALEQIFAVYQEMARRLKCTP